MSILEKRKEFWASSEGRHICCRCIHANEVRDGDFSMTAGDVNSCELIFDYYCDNSCYPIETEDNGGGYWITKCKYFEYDERWDKPTYHEYMKSPEWKAKREERLKHDKYQCQLCHTAINLVVHHLTYDRLGDEDLNDLVTLCKKCHEKVHEKDLEEKSKCGRK